MPSTTIHTLSERIHINTSKLECINELINTAYNTPKLPKEVVAFLVLEKGKLNLQLDDDINALLAYIKS